MLRGIRTASSNWLGRTIMGLVLGMIAISFAIWGVGDIFKGFGRSTVAKVGSTEITVNDFRQIYTDRLQQLGRQLGRPVTPEQARNLQLDQQLVGQLVAEAAIDQRARQLRLNLSDEEVRRQIMSDPNFKGTNGQFERIRFDQMIRSAGYTEARYAAEQKRLTIRREIAETVSGELPTPKSMADAYNRYENEQRAIDYVTFEAAKAGDIPAPTPEQLTKYFEDRKATFRTPEFRTVTILSVSPADLARPETVNDADAKRFYELNLNRFGSPERRQLQQIAFPNEDDAKAAAERLQKSEITFEALAQERGLTDKDIDLGTETKAGLIDRAVADAAFALAEGGVSAPVKGTFGIVLVRVVKIEPENIKPFDQVSAEIKQTLATERARSELASRHDKIEDERAAGSKLSEIAQKLNLTSRTIEAVDRQGRDPEGKAVDGLPSGVDVVTNAFNAAVNVENEPLQLTGGGYVWYEVNAIKPAADRTLDQVKTEVEEGWRNAQIADRLRTKANDMIAKIKAGTSFTDAAAANEVPVKTTFGLKRSGNTNATIPAAVVEAVFRASKDEPASSVGANAAERVVFIVTDISAPTFDAASAEGRRIQDTIRRSLTEDIIGQYVARLQTEFGATINQTALRQVSAGGSEQN